LIFTLFVGTVFYVVALISHVISYPLLIFAAFFLFKRMGRVRLFPLLLLTPVLGVMSWLSYDRIVPDFHSFDDEMLPYQHGLTLERFLIGWG
ncbi:hypothetical protein, partial [Stenotrophomonas maltophilia]|uniref:hypothetical protein n=1 Tax=Stenotrophomonas maltophilia TaxID=40324 RepID=UPI0013DB5674